MKSKHLIGLLAFGALFSGCASLVTVELPDDQIKPVTSGILGIPEKDFTVSNKKVIGMIMYYTATTKKGVKYQCRSDGGGPLSLGQIRAECEKASSK